MFDNLNTSDQPDDFNNFPNADDFDDLDTLDPLTDLGHFLNTLLYTITAALLLTIALLTSNHTCFLFAAFACGCTIADYLNATNRRTLERTYNRLAQRYTTLAYRYTSEHSQGMYWYDDDEEDDDYDQDDYANYPDYDEDGDEITYGDPFASSLPPPPPDPTLN